MSPLGETVMSLLGSFVELIYGFSEDFAEIQPFLVIHLTFAHLWAVHALVPCS